MTLFKIASAVLLLVFIEVVLSRKANPTACYDPPMPPTWRNDYWVEAPYTLPDTTGIPNFPPPGAPTSYVWLQADTSLSRTGHLTSPSFLMRDGDVVTATFYRHIVELDGSERITLSFVTPTGSKELLHPENDDIFDTVSITCDRSTMVCCDLYPCYGYFTIEATVLAEDELMAVSHVGVNCPPTNSTYCCTFATDVCQWDVGDGWHWSGTRTPSNIPPFTGYIWIENSTDTIYSNSISAVATGATFYLTYEFQSSSNTSSAKVIIGDYYAGSLIPGAGVQTFTHTCSTTDCCEITSAPCDTQLGITVVYAPDSLLSLSINDLGVNDPSCDMN